MGAGACSGYRKNPAETNWIGRLARSFGAIDDVRYSIPGCRQGWGKLRMARSVIGEPLRLGDVVYQYGYGTHASGQIDHTLCAPGGLLTVDVGIDRNRNTTTSTAQVQFSIWSGERCLAESPILQRGDAPFPLSADLDGATAFSLKCEAVGSESLAHCDWGEPRLTFSDGRTIMLGHPDFPPVDTVLPVSFSLGEESAGNWFRRCGIRKSEEAGATFDTFRFQTSDGETGLFFELVLRLYHELPACLWEATLRNDGRCNTSQLRSPKSLDLSLCFPGNTKKLFRSTGSFDYLEAGEAISSEAYRDGFMMREDNLVAGSSRLSGTGGRSSVDSMPYLNFEGEGEGLMLGIGWTGQWCAEVSADSDLVRFEAGIENFDSYLKPGETVRLPSILLIAWEGDSSLRGHNLLRRFINDELLPKYSGETLQAPSCAPAWGGMTAAKHLERIAEIQARKLRYDYYWVDAGWYGTSGPSADEFSPNWGCQAGDWRVDAEIYPNGLSEVSEACHRAGLKFLLWGEPERAVHGRPTTLEHPEWFLGPHPRAEGNGLIINYGNPEAWTWAVETFSRLIAENGIDCYRQDFNASPLPFWTANDEENRVGITEAKYVDGLYRFLGELRRRFPHLLIDNCAGGGRRLDFEMMRHSVPLWASDMQVHSDCLAERNMQLVQGLSFWLPQFAFGTQFHPGDTYHIRSALAAGLTFFFCYNERVELSPEYPYDWHRERLEEYHRVKEFFSGDFYPILESSSSFKTWAAYQFDRPDLGAGVVLFFRKRESPFVQGHFVLQGGDPDALYELEDGGTPGLERYSGAALFRNGIPITLPNPASSKLLFYRKVSDS
jgi:alpha-galactosidase